MILRSHTGDTHFVEWRICDRDIAKLKLLHREMTNENLKQVKELELNEHFLVA